MAGDVLVTGLGHMHPEHKISNEFFAELGIDSAPDWVVERTGIESRYSVLTPELLRALRHEETNFYRLKEEGLMPSLAGMTPEPWQQACERSRVEATFQPELVICGTSVPDYDIPANASSIAKLLHLNATAFDVNSACSSFITDVAVAASLLRGGSFRSAAVFNAERYSTRLDYRDRRSCILFGDGATAALLELATPEKSGLLLLDSVVHSDPQGADLVTIPIPGYFFQNGARVQKFAITRTCEVTHEILARNQLRLSDINYFVGHQANLRMLQSAAGRLGFEDGQHLYNVDRCGNQGAAGAPAVLSENWHLFKKGDYIVVAVVGSGLTWAAALFQKV